MEYGYNILFYIRLQLDNDPCTDFIIVPTKACQQVLANHGLIFKNREDGCFVAGEYFIDDANNISIPRPFNKIEKLSFLMILQNGAFIQHAALPENTQTIDRVGRKIYYFDNLDANNALDGGINNNTLNLTAAAQADVADIGSIIPNHYRFYVDQSVYNEIDLFQPQPNAADLALDPVFKSGMTQAEVLFDNTVHGNYKLEWKGTQQKTEMIYADADLLPQSFFGIIEIYKDAAANDAIKNNVTTNYIISFKKN